jgi:hypothetical protein
LSNGASAAIVTSLFTGRQIPVSSALVGETLGLEERDDGQWIVYIGPRSIGLLLAKEGRIEGLYDHKTL